MAPWKLVWLDEEGIEGAFEIILFQALWLQQSSTFSEQIQKFSAQEVIPKCETSLVGVR